MDKRFGTETKHGHNRYSVYENNGSLLLKCVQVGEDVDFGLGVIGISGEEYNELYDAHLEGDDILRMDAGYMFYKRTKKI